MAKVELSPSFMNKNQNHLLASPPHVSNCYWNYSRINLTGGPWRSQSPLGRQAGLPSNITTNVHRRYRQETRPHTPYIFSFCLGTRSSYAPPSSPNLQLSFLDIGYILDLVGFHFISFVMGYPPGVLAPLQYLNLTEPWTQKNSPGPFPNLAPDH